MRNLLLIGGGGHCLTVIDSLNQTDYHKIGIIDTPDKIGQEVCGIPVVGCDGDLSSLRDEYDNAFISLGSIGSCEIRMMLAKKLTDLSYAIPYIIHTTASVSTDACINYGVLIGPHASVNAYSEIAYMCIINTGSIVEHQCIIEPYTHIAPGAILCANVKVGEGSHIGAGSVVRQGISIASNVLVGIGSVVTGDIPGNVVAYGNPCRVIEKRDAI